MNSLVMSNLGSLASALTEVLEHGRPVSQKVASCYAELLPGGETEITRFDTSKPLKLETKDIMTSIGVLSRHVVDF